MYVGSMIRAPGYASGETVNTIQKRRLRGSVTDISVQVGNTITIPQDMRIVCLSELFLTCMIDRYFVQLGNERIVPIYLRMVNVSEVEHASVLLCNSGISEVFRILQGKGNRNQLLRNVMLDCVADELSHVDPSISEMIRDTPVVRPMEQNLGNDTAEVLPESQPGVTSVGYPWNIVNQLQPTIKCWLDQDVETQHTKYANYLADMALSVSAMDEGPNMVLLELSEFMTPAVPIPYQDLMYDPLTTLMSTERMIPRKELLYWLTRPNKIPTQWCMLPDRSQYERPTELSSNILEFCVWVHNLPYLECGGKYILPTKNTPEQFYWTTRDRGNIDDQVWTGLVNNTVRSLYAMCRHWDPTLTEIEFLKSRYDELFVHFVSNGITKKYYFDLSICTLLSQAIAQLD